MNAPVATGLFWLAIVAVAVTAYVIWPPILLVCIAPFLFGPNRRRSP